MYNIKQSTAITVPFFAHDVNGDGVTGMVDGGFTKRISKNGGAFGAMTVTISELENGWYSFPLSTSHSDTTGLLSISLSNGSAKRVNLQFRVQAKLTDDLNDFDATTDTVATVTTLSNLPAITANWLTAAGINANALDGKGDWNVGKTGYSLTQAFPSNFADMSIAITTGLVDITQTAADKVWGTGTRVLTANTNLNDPTAATIAAAVWDLDATAHQTTGTFGQAIGDPVANTKTLYAALVTDAVGASVTADVATAQADLDIITGADGVNLLSATQTTIDDIPNTAEFQARTLPSASYFDWTTDTVANVTLVATTTDVTNQVSADVTAISGDSVAADNLEATLETIIASTATGIPTTTSMPDSSITETTTDHYVGRVIIWRTGAAAGIAATVTGYTTGQFTFATTVTACSSGDAYALV